MQIISIHNPVKFVEKITHKNKQDNKKTAESILSQVQKKGDVAVKKYEKQFGGYTTGSLRVSEKEIANAYSQVSKIEIDAIKLAKKRLTITEKSIKSKLTDTVLNSEGVKISKKFSPIGSVGCYIPGGLARYPSTVIMSVVPAKVSGVQRIVVVSPTNKQGKIDPLTIVAADVCGVDEIYKVGGIQAIAALAYGTRSIKKVSKIVGPGGSFVTLAKSLVSNEVGIDMLAGPTELGIIVNSDADSRLVSLDIISQAEHSKDTFCYVLTTSSSLAKKIQKQISQSLKTIKRQKIVSASIQKNGFIGVCKNEKIMIQIANLLAPEHLQIMGKNSNKIAGKITNAGLVLIGNNSPSAASDYLLGSNHILPTNQFGKVRGSLSVLDFIKLNTTISTTKNSLQKISKYMDALTTAEDLPNHYEAVRGRL